MLRHVQSWDICNRRHLVYLWGQRDPKTGRVPHEYQDVGNLNLFMKHANPKDTYIFICSPGCKEQWDRTYPILKKEGWIVYESPMFFNLVHPERRVPSLQLFIIEKPHD